ncbi:uncharacterized protein LOC126611391 isoform X34 [Malus sylvestris]|uniref:uncharacterized protein LOC126611391 isoform X34 n=1 Tax=Malus sylvestris TaxID=3752 RepID=UPI0021AD3C72|nr:uncharacterized protein LOC126611391 isoform X34 [Malus sylvestris]
MATEAEVPESVSATTEGEGGHLTTGKFDITVNQFSPVQLKKSEGEEDQRPEPVKCFVEGEITHVESKNGISECGNPLETLLDSKVDKQEEDAWRKGGALDIGEASVVVEEDSEGCSAVEHSKTSSTDHEGESETNLYENIQPVIYEVARTKLNSEEDKAATLRESSKTITTAEDERQVVEQSCKEEGKVEEANTSYDTIGDETPDEQNLPVASILMRIVTESEIAEVGESTISEPNEIVETSEEVLNVSTVKGDEGDQGDGTNVTKDDKDVDTFSAKVAEDDEYTSAVTIKETSAKVTPNDDESSPQTLQKCDSGEELQHSRDVLPEETKTETSRENAEESTCKKEETTIQHTQESLDEEKKEATENTSNLEDDNAREEVLETSGTKQETGEHFVGEIHTESTQDFVDKETNEETSTESQACVEAADLSTYTEEKNLEEQAILELSSPLAVEETAKEIPKEEETGVLILKEENKEEDAECNEPAEVASLTHETQSETTEDTTEPNKGLSAPISEESNKTFVENISTLAEVSETETEKNIQEKDGLAVGNSDSASGEVSHVTGLKEAETEKEEQKENIDTAPEEKGQATILKDETALEVEDIGVQAEENCESKENLEEHIPTAADEGEAFSKEADVQAEKNEKSFDVEDTNVQAEKNVESNENLEENIPRAADEGETFSKEAEAESKDEIKNDDIAHPDIDGDGDEIDSSEENLDKQIPAGECETSLKAAEAEYKEQDLHADIAPEEKGLATILTDETPKDCVESKEKVEEQITTADEGEKSTYISPEDSEVQEDENFITLENLEKPIRTTSGERETGLGEAEAEIKEQVKSIDIVPEEMATISTTETPLDVEDIGVQAEETLKSKENVEEHIPTAADEGEKFLKEAEAENKEQIDEETLNSQESSDKEKEEVTEITNTKDDTEREEVLETTSTEQETGEHVVHEIHRVPEPPRDSIDKETNEDNSAEYQACTEVADVSTSAEEKNLEEHAIRELSSPLVVEEATKEIPEVERQDKNIDTAPEEKGQATISADEMASEVEDIDVQLKENLESEENLEEQFLIAADEGEIISKDAKAENQEQIKNVEEKKEEDTECNEPSEVASMTHETRSETTEDITEPNKDLNAPISGESNKTFVENISTLAEVSETETEKNGLAVSNSDSASGEVSHVTGLKEAETEKEEQKENIDTAPEEKVQATVLKDEMASEVEDIGVQAEENCESKEKLEEHIPTAADKVETFSKEAEAENEEQINNGDVAAEEKVLETILTNERTFDVEDTNVEAEKNVESNENLEETIPTAADEGETSLQEAEAESKDEIKSTEAESKDEIKSADIVPEEKGLATVLTDETPLDVEDIEVKTEDCVESKENVEEQIPTTADEGEKSTYISPEDIEVQADEFITLENLEKPILTSGERETGLGEAEAEIKEQVKSIDIVPEEMATISTAETPSDVEVIGVQAEESLKSKENMEEQIPTAPDEGGKFLKESKAENKELIDEENLNSQESSDKGKQEVTETTNTLEDDTAREEVLETTCTEQETGEHVVHEIHTVVETPRDSFDKETNEENSAGYQACTDAADLSTTAEEKNLEEHDIQELSPLVVEEETNEIPKEEETYATLLEEEKKEGHATCNEPTEKYEAEIEKNIQEKDGNTVSNSESLSGELSHVTASHESETEIERQDKNIDTAAEEKGQATILKENIDTAPEEKGQATILKGKAASEVEDIGVQAEEKCESKENLEEHIPTAADKVETFSKEAEAENEEQINNSDVAAEEKVLETILTNEKSFDVEDTNVQAEKNVESNEDLEENVPTAADEGETFPKEAEAESKDDIKNADIPHADIDGHGDEIDSSEENLDKQIPAGECETSLKAAEAEYKEQVIHADIAPEEKGLATILTDETPLDVEDIEVKTKDCAESKENVEEQIPTTANEGEKSTYISHEHIEVQADENFITLENLENPIPTTSGERETGLGEAEAEIKEQVKSIDIVPEEMATISTTETPLDVEDIGVQAEETLKSKENVEEHIPTAADEGEKVLKEAEAENKEQIDEETLNSQESSDKEKEEVTEITNTKDDTEREEVLETTSTEQETGEHVVHDIHTVPEPPRDSIDKETNEDNSAEYQECTEAADLSTSAEEKNLEEHAIQELSSPLVVEEATNEIPMEEETYTTLLEEEEKEAHATCNEPNEEYEAEIEKNIQEKDGNTVGNSESLSGELSHVTALKESETEIEKQDKNIDTAPEEKGQATISADETASEVEDIDVQLKENLESEENLEEQFPIAAVEGEIMSKEAEAENKEQIKNVDIAHEDVDAQAEKTVNSEENIDYQIQPIAHAGETSLKEAEAEDKEQVTYADIAPEEKGLATILTDETPLEAEDIGVKAEESFESKEKSEEKNPIAADEDETFLKEAEADNKEQIKYSDITPEDKGLATILTDEKALNIEDIGLQADETFNTSKNLESKIPSTADEHETSLKEAEAINTEQFKYTDIVPEEKGLANIVMDETSLDVEDIDVKSDEVSKSKENVEEKIPSASHERGTFLNEAEAESKEHIYNTDISPEEKSLATISTDEATLDVEDIGVQAEGSFESKEDFKEKIPTEDEMFLKEAEAETKEHIKCSDIAPEEKGLENILTDETSLDAKDIEVQAEESFESNENLKEQIPTAEGEGETRLREAEAKSDEQVKNDIASEEKVLETISKDETALDIDDAYVQLQAEENSNTKEFSDEENPTAAAEGEEKIAHGNVVLNDTPGVQILEEAEPKVGVEEESCKSEAQPEKTSTIVEEVFDESKITGRDFNTEEIVEGNVACFTQESIGEDTVNKSQEIETENKNLKEEGSCIESLKEGNGDDLSPEHIPEDESETFKDDEKDAVKSGGEILKRSQADGVDESITCETERSEEIVTSPVTCEEGEQGESSSPVSKEEGSNEDTFSTKVAEVGNGDNGAVMVIETSAGVNGEEGLPQAVQEYEPVEGHEKLLDLMPEESKTESSSENAEVVTCTKEEIKIQNIQESLDEEKKEEETTPVNDTKENETEVEEVFEIASTEQETGEHASREIHPDADNTQEFNDKETTEENLNEYQVSSEAADSSTDIVGKNTDEQASRELSSSLIGEDTSIESSKQEENYVLSLKEEENEANVECKEPVEVANTAHETKFETLEDSIEPKEDLYAPTSEEETHTDLKGAEAETKEQVKDIEIDHEEKGLATILTDGAALENVDSEEFSENQIQTVADEGEYNTELSGDKAAEESFQVQSLEEAEPKLRVEDESRESEDHPENNSMIVEEPQLPEQVLDKPKSTGRDFSEGQTTEGNAAICTPERIQEETAKNSQDSDKETENLMEEGSSIESVKACNTDDPSQEFILEDGSKKFGDNKQDTVKFKGEILKETEIAGVGESTTYETNQIAESSEEISGAAPVKYEEGQPGEGSSQDSAKASKDEDVTEDDDNNGAVTVTESSAEVTSKGEEESAQALEKSEPEEDKVRVKISDVADAKEVCDLEDKASFAEKTSGETSLQTEGHAEVSELALEKLDVEATEEEFKESSEVVPESDSRSIDVVSKDEIVTSQTLDEGISQEQVEIPSSTLLTEAKEIEASQHEHETPTKDKNIEEEHEKEMPADENARDLSAERSEDETPLQKEESKELKASELALEKLDAGDTEEGIKETLKTISKSDSQSIDAVSKDEIVADQTHLEASYALLPMEEELKTYQEDRETTTQDRFIEEEYAKKTEVPADENGSDLVAATLAEETLLKEEPGELKVSELAPENLDAGETKEEIKKSFEKVSKSDSQSTEVVSGDETTAYQTELVGDKAVEESFQVQSLEEAEPKLRVEDESRESEDHPENNNMIVEEPQLLQQVLDEPKSTDGDSSEGQTTKRSAAICAPEIIEEGTAKHSQDCDKETENSQEEILKEPEIAGVGESTTYETNQIAETPEEFFDASPVKYEEGQPGEGSSQDSAKASKEEDVTEDDDNNDAVTVTESNAEVTSKGEEDSAQPLEKYEPEEEKVPVKISDVADAKEVCDVEDKSSFAEKTTEETSLQTEGHAEVSELAPEKLDVEATEEEFKEGSEIVRESDSRSIDVILKDEIATSQTLDEGISQEQVEIPSSTLLTEAKEIEASQHEHETPTNDKNIEEEHEQEMPADENAGDLSAVRSEDETPLPKEESEELKPSALALEKLDAGDTEEEIEETFKTISKSDSQSTDAVPKDEIVADQTHLEASYALLPKEEELKTYQDDHETTTQDKGVEEEYAKETEVPADESGRDLVAPTLAEETLLQKEEPEELKVSDLAPENLDAGETEEEIKESFEKVSKSDSQSSEVVSGDETTANQTLHEGISNEQLQLPSSTLVPEEKEIKISQREHETTTQDKNKEDGSTEKNEVPADENTRDLFVAATSEEETCLQKEEPREFKACDLAPEKLDADETEEIKETLETISKSDSQNIDTVSKDDIVADQTLDGASYTSLPKEKEHEAGESETTAYWALHEGESNTELAGVKAVEESFQVQSLEEAEPKLRVEDESRESEDHPENNMIVEEPQLLEHVLDEPKSTDGDFGEGQTTEGNAALCTPDIILEESPKNSQNIDKEAENLQEEILEEPEIAGVGKSTTYETNQIAETSEEIFDASPVKYGEGSSQDSAKASKEEDVTEDDDNNGAVTVTESSAEVTSKGEEDLAHALEKYEPEEEKVPVKISDVADTKEVCDLEDKASFAEKTTEETSLQTEGQAEVSELAPEKLAVNATEEECKEGSEIVPESDSRSIDVVSKDEIVTSLTLDEGISQDQVKIPSSTLLAEAKEIEASQHEHETPTKDKNIEEEHEKEVLADENAGDLYAVGSEDKTPLQKEESEELKASTLALEKLDAGDTEEEIKETFKTISTSDSQSTDAVPKDEIVADQTHLEASYASLPKEEELKTYQDDREIATQEKSIEEVYAKETEVPADENARDLVAAALAEETLLQKDEPGELKVSVLAPENLDARETEEMKKTLDTVSEPDYQITAVVTSDEAISDQTLHEGISTEKLQIPSSVLLPEEKEIKASEEHGTTFSDKNIEENASNLQMQDDENTKATSTAKETSLTKEEPRELKASDFELHLTQEVPRESSNEEITEDEKLPEESEPDSVREESHHENKAKAEKQGEQTDETSTIRTNEHQNELSEVDEKGIPSEKYERQLTFEDLTIKEHDPRFIEDKTIQDGFPEDEKRVEEAAFEFGLKNQDDEINSKSSITETQMEKDSKKSPIAETSQEVEAKDSKSTNETCVAPEIKERIQMGTHSPEEKEATTTSKEQQIEEDEEEEHESCEEVKTDEEKGENEHKNGEPGYDSPIMVEASRDADVNVKVVSHKKSNNILSGIKHSISKVKKAITGKSSHSKTKSEK